MCAIVGFWDLSGAGGRLELERIAGQMASVLRHRGPDDQGTWADVEAGLALGHRRLAILDLTQEGHQPMHSSDWRYVLVFNGELYNFEALRDELRQRGHAFRGRCDTEVMLAAFSEWGLPLALSRFEGMFAFALWDRQKRRLHLGRDRAGEKPLYYGYSGGAFLFGSELKAFRAHPRWRGEIDGRALTLLIRYGYIPSPHCIYDRVFKLLPGCTLTLTETDLREGRTAEPVPYWSAGSMAEAGAAHPFDGTAEQAREELQTLLLQAVRQQMVADVPLGAFLSGGIDSSLVVALMQAQSLRPVRTFSIGFRQEAFNEAPFARKVAAHLGTDHTELYVEEKDVLEVIAQLPRVYDEPLADPSQIPTVLLCRLAGAHVRVSLSGDGGDELFGGYEDYRKAQRLWRVFRRVPLALRQRLTSGLRPLALASLGLRLEPRWVRHGMARLANLTDVLPAPSDASLYHTLLSPNRDPQVWMRDPAGNATLSGSAAAWERLPELLQRMTALDFVTYLPDDVLVKVDRAAMAVSLETRIPWLDRQVIEFAYRLPVSLKQRGGQGKWLLRQMLYRLVPRPLVDRPKRGFAAPIAPWLRGPLRSWAEHLLEETRLRQEGFFDWRRVGARWRQHLREERDWSAGLWHVLMFQAWLEDQKPTPSLATAPDPGSRGKRDTEPCLC